MTGGCSLTQASVSSGPRILIVDDNENIHRDFRKIFEGPSGRDLRAIESALFGETMDETETEIVFDHQLDDAYQGEEAVRMVDEAVDEGKPYSLIYMDVRMPPGIDGIQAVKRIWQRHPEIEIVVCSAHSDYSWNQMVGEVGTTDKLHFIRKPFDMVSVQQLTLSLTKKWELSQTTKAYIKRLEGEMWQREKAQRDLRTLNETLEQRIRDRTAAFEEANAHLHDVVDELRQAQSQLVASEKMAALGELVAGVAHEINTPVGVSVTAASHLHNRTGRVVGAMKGGALKRSELEKFLHTCSEASSIILTNLNRAAELIHSFKQVAVDQSSEKRRSFALIPYMKEVLLSLHPHLKHTPHSVEITGDEHIVLESFPGAFAQIFANLVTNSLAHAFEDHVPGKMFLEVHTKGERLHITYRDNGRGIAQEDLGKIYHPFFTTKRGQGGSGLGLNIVHNLVCQTLNGNIRCESSPGKGVCFEIDLPLTEPDEMR